jgi:tRNA pseudouridine38-40 synthase
MATALVKIGAGEAEEGCIASLLREVGGRGIPPAPAEGLILWETDCGITFTPMEQGDRSMAYLGYLQGHHALMERVCGALGNGRSRADRKGPLR